MDFVDTSLGQVVSALKTKGIYDDTLIIVASKHGQAPVDPKLYGKADPTLFNPAIVRARRFHHHRRYRSRLPHKPRRH